MFSHRGRGSASYGRRVKDSALKSQMVLVEDDDVIVHSLPQQKPRPNKMAHSLKEAVQKNRQNARKH